MVLRLLEQLRLRMLRDHLQPTSDVLEAKCGLGQLRLGNRLGDEDHRAVGPRGQVGGGLLRRRGQHGRVKLRAAPGRDGNDRLDGVHALDAPLGEDVGDVVGVLGVDRPDVVLEEALAGEGALAHLAVVGAVARVLHHVPHQRVLVPEVERADGAREVFLRLRLWNK